MQRGEGGRVVEARFGVVYSENTPALIAAVARDHPEADGLRSGSWTKRASARPDGSAGAGSRRACAPGMRDLGHQAAYLFGVVCPARDAGVALVLPTVSAAAMQAMLNQLGQEVSPRANAVVLMDRAGWHIAKDLAVPANLRPLFLPSYSPELNAIERV
jgi:DDE superfamily endonuclease